MRPKIFVCHSTQDARFVIQVCSHLKPSCDEVFYYESQQRPDQGFSQTISDAQARCDHMVIFVGDSFSRWQEDEVAFALALDPRPKCCVVLIANSNGEYPESPKRLAGYWTYPRIEVNPWEVNAPLAAAWRIMQSFGAPLQSFDGLPFDPNLFSYEKDIISFFTNMVKYKGDFGQFGGQETVGEEIREKLLNGCPSEWPGVTRWTKGTADPSRNESYVVAAALNTYHDPDHETCMVKHNICFPEARPAEGLYFTGAGNLHIAILVAGGIAPGINAVIDGIVQRHWMYAKKGHKHAIIEGIRNGLSAFDLGLENQDQDPDNPDTREQGAIREGTLITLAPSSNDLADANIPDGLLRTERMYTAEHVREGGSMIGTSRVDNLISDKKLLEKVANALLGQKIKILYIIGGDGSMRLAHALWQHINTNPDDFSPLRRLSVVAVPKTMDNDILWVWQSFGFLSAVEKAREILSSLDAEVKSNPRFLVLQLFGSDSGFVVSHTVAASGSDQCYAALIPEVKFSLRELARYLKKRMCERISIIPSAIVPAGLVVMAETAIPTDAICYIDAAENIPGDLREDYDFIRSRIGLDNDLLSCIAEKIDLSNEEREAIYQFHRMRRRGQRIQGQTSDILRNAGLKIVSRGLQKLLVLEDEQTAEGPQPDWSKLRDIITNEPRHILRAIPPTCSDIIMGQRLGTLAVDNAMAGYTDFMISQWLTEFVLVPLKLVILGRKRIPMQGMFWKSVLARTGQPPELDIVGEFPEYDGVAE